jgi:hypothetical protein
MKESMIAFFAAFVAFALLSAGCIQQNATDEKENAAFECIQACYVAKQTKSLQEGPCLLDPIPKYPGWVCDVAHSPRQSVDDNASNQCAGYGKSASHFVEVTPDCKLIRAR